ncbi:hypothetical protein, conserved [Eimeria maxima]|uniref:Uncharacterized protein n=1 Tax=Eimeria maxima TaxID=5804 RepID=U6MFE0_EIMMA|nr:hypothetical protein, conserved [Eimeria maxima]CDJ60375.1 hypothetical protein, conserved [Eimeria maxima]
MGLRPVAESLEELCHGRRECWGSVIKSKLTWLQRRDGIRSCCSRPADFWVWVLETKPIAALMNLDMDGFSRGLGSGRSPPWASRSPAVAASSPGCRLVVDSRYVVS